MPAFINSHVTKFRFSDVPVCEGATEHGSEKPQWKQQLSNAGLQGQVPTCWLLFSMSLMHQTLCLGNTDSCSVNMVDRERVHNTSRAMLNKHLNTSCVWCRKQLTLSRVAGSRIQSSQSPAPSITKVPLSSPVLGYDHTDSEENEITSAEPFPFHKSTARAVGRFTHAHSHSTVEYNPAMPWWAVPASASPGGQQWVLLLKWQPLAALTIPHFLDRTSPAPGLSPLTVTLKPRNYITSYQHHSKPSTGHADSVVTLTSSKPQHRMEQRNSHSIPGRRPSRV